MAARIPPPAPFAPGGRVRIAEEYAERIRRIRPKAPQAGVVVGGSRRGNLRVRLDGRKLVEEWNPRFWRPENAPG